MSISRRPETECQVVRLRARLQRGSTSGPWQQSYLTNIGHFFFLTSGIVCGTLHEFQRFDRYVVKIDVSGHTSPIRDTVSFSTIEPSWVFQHSSLMKIVKLLAQVCSKWNIKVVSCNVAAWWLLKYFHELCVSMKLLGTLIVITCAKVVKIGEVQPVNLWIIIETLARSPVTACRSPYPSLFVSHFSRPIIERH